MRAIVRLALSHTDKSLMCGKPLLESIASPIIVNHFIRTQFDPLLHSITCLPHTWTSLPRQAADEHFPRKERRFHQAGRPAAGCRRKRKRTQGDCQQRVTSGDYNHATPCAVSRPWRQVSPHINQQSNNTHLFLSHEHVSPRCARIPDLPIVK